MEAQMTRKLLRGYGEIFLPSDNILDQSVTKEILTGKAYPLIAGPNDVFEIWDIGANIGAATLYFAKSYPQAHITCWEPSQDIVWECLEENANRIQERTTLYPYGLAGSRSVQIMNEWGTSTVTRSCKRQIADVEITSLPAWNFEMPPQLPDGIGIVKIDTEGCEVEILTAMSDRNRVPIYYIEYHSENDRRAIDQLLPEHHLARCSAERKHRGNLTYVHKDINTVEDKFEIL